MKRPTNLLASIRSTMGKGQRADKPQDDTSSFQNERLELLEASLERLALEADKAKRSLVQLITAIHRATSLNLDAGQLDEAKLTSLRFRLDFLGTEAQRATMENGFSQPELVGREYNVSMPVDAVNLEEFSTTDELFISSVVEPLLLSGDNVIQRGRVLVNTQTHDAEDSA